MPRSPSSPQDARQAARHATYLGFVQGRPGSERKRIYHHRDLRRALLTTALDLLPEVGADRLSLRAIARRAGVSPAAPYHHFEDKEALLAALAGECAQLLLDALEGAIVQAGEDQRRRFQLTGVAYVRFAVASPAHFRALELPGITARMPSEIRQRMDAFYAEEGRRMRAAQADGLFAPLPFDRLILAATSLVHGLAHLLINGATDGRPGDVEHAARLAQEVTGVFGVGLLPRPPPPARRR
jgi:AcrR family transcriptional regulator